MNIKPFLILTLGWVAVVGVSTLHAGDPPPEVAASPTSSFQLRMELDSTGRLHYKPFPMPPIDKILNPSGATFLIGPYIGVNAAMHSGGFTITENGLTCCRFDKGSGLGVVGGIKAFIPLTENIDLSPRIAYEGRPGTFNDSSEPLPFLGANNQVELLRFDEELEAKLAAITFDILGTYTFTEFGLYAALGPSGAIFAGKSFTKIETIPGPAGVLYKSGGTSRQVTSGDLTNLAGLQLDLRGGAGVKYPITETLFLNPEVLYSFPLSTVTTVDSWKTSGLQGTLGLLISF